MAVGRPPIYNSVEDILPVIQEWFDSIQSGEKPTITGLCLALGFESKDTLYAYRDKPEFSYPIKKCLLIVENGYEKALRENSSTGSIFALKNMGWKDKVEQEQYGKDGGPIENKLTVEILKGSDQLSRVMGDVRTK